MMTLKPCPVCGGKAYIEEGTDAFSAVYNVARCEECGIEVIVYVDMTKTIEWNKQRVIERWNKRPSPWHTGTPPIEEIDEDNQYCYALCFFYDGWWLSDYLFRANHEKGCFETAPRDNEKVSEFKFSDCIYWQKIEPYEGEK